MRRVWFFWLLEAVLALAVVAPASAATVLERTERYSIDVGGTVTESVRLRVRLEDAADIAAWDRFAVPLDENRSLEDFDARVIQPGKSPKKVGRRQQDKVESSGDFLYDSAHYHVVDFEGLTPGSELMIEYRVKEEPYFPAGRMALAGQEPIEHLSVTIDGAGAAWRYRVEGPMDGLTVEGLEGGVRIIGRDLPAVDPPSLAASGAAVYPILHFAWGGGREWRDVGEWHLDLSASVPRDAAAVRALAQELAQGLETPRQKLEAALAFLRRKVRYVAVEVGIGGYRPSAPGEVLERKWGDCKDKSYLLIDLLREMGIEAHPMLILLDRHRRIDPDFPSPGSFNHLIVAVDTEGLEVEPEDPVSEGYLFLDPTQTRGGIGWLHAGVQDQYGLLTVPGESHLVRLPVRPSYEGRILALDLDVDAEGNAKGRAGLRLRGSFAASWLDRIENQAPERTAEDVRDVFSHLLPGSRLSEVGWSAEDEEGEVPQMRMSMAVEIDSLVEGIDSSRGPSFRVEGLRSTPEPRKIDELAETTARAAVVSAQVSTTYWRLKLPEDWCLPESSEKVTETAVGTFRQKIVRGGKRALDARTHYRDPPPLGRVPKVGGTRRIGLGGASLRPASGALALC